MEEHISSERHWTLDPSLRPYFVAAASIAVVCALIGVILNSVSIHNLVFRCRWVLRPGSWD